MSRIVQEKFQVDYPQNSNDDSHSGWVTDKSARVKKGNPGREGRSGGDPESRHMDNAVMTLSLPPGMDMEDQEFTDQRVMPTVTSGESDISKDWNREAASKGYTCRHMRPTDDQYTREHNDAFYDEMTVDGDTGFIERNNVLDRM